MTDKPYIDSPVLDGNVFSLYWKKWFSSLWEGDVGKQWTPTYTSLTESGTATHTGTYYRLSKRLYYFRVLITPATNTSSTAGTTFLNNFPLTINANGSFLAINNTTKTRIDAGAIIAGSGFYPPSWTTITAPITLCGMVEAS